MSAQLLSGKMLSPGGNTILVSREFDEIIGSYGHLFAFDFEMLRLILNSGDLVILKIVKLVNHQTKEISKIYNHLFAGDKKYSLKDTFVKKKKKKKKKKKI